MNPQHGQYPAAPATLWDAAEALHRLRDELVELSLALRDLQFELPDDTCRAAHESALILIANAFSGNASKRPS
ncbi:MAG: hypothetical protein IPN53_08265 [Comamonadaceae bacterium]|nr:hypothetical protein [Comamonadaceae bacterium]